MANPFPPVPEYMVATNAPIPAGVNFVPLLLQLFARYGVHYHADGSGGVIMEIWNPKNSSDFARAVVKPYTKADGTTVFEVQKEKGSGTLVARIFHAMVAALAGGIDAAPESLGGAAEIPREPPSFPVFVEKIQPIVQGLDSPRPDSVLNAAQYFCVLAIRPEMVHLMALHENLTAALFRVLDPDRRLPEENVTTALAALDAIARATDFVPSFSQRELLTYWRNKTAVPDLPLSLYHMRAILAATTMPFADPAAPGGAPKRRKSKPSSRRKSKPSSRHSRRSRSRRSRSRSRKSHRKA